MNIFCFVTLIDVLWTVTTLRPYPKSSWVITRTEELIDSWRINRIMENDTVIIVRCSPASVNTQAIFSISSFLILKSKIKDKQEWLKKEKTYFAYPYRIKSVWTEVSLTFTSIHNKYCVVSVEYTVSQDCTPTRWKAVCCFLHPWRRWVSHSITPDWWISTWGHTWCSTSVLTHRSAQFLTHL